MTKAERQEFKADVEIAVREYISQALLNAHAINARTWDEILSRHFGVKK